MPIFEFRCEKCHEQFEELVLGEGQDVACPSCGSKQTSKLISACRFRNGGVGDSPGSSQSTSSSSSCASCSGGDCSTCGG